MAAAFQVALQRLDACEFGMGPLLEQLLHHQAFKAVHGAVGRIAAVPIGHGQDTTGGENPEELVRVALLIRHMGAGFHAPDPRKAGLWQLEGHGIHHGKLAAQACWCEGAGPFNLQGADADTQDVEAVIAGQDAGAAADTATHVQHLGSGGELVEPAPAHQFMDEGPFGLAKVFFPPVALRVVAQMDVVTPEPFQQLIAGPPVVGLGHALGIAVAAPALEP